MSKCLDPFRFLLISLAVWMNQQANLTRPSARSKIDPVAFGKTDPC